MELDTLELAGQLPPFPIEPAFSYTWDGRFYLADKYRIVTERDGRFTLMPLEHTTTASGTDLQ